MSEAKIGIGGAPTRCTTMPEGAAERKWFPIASGFMDYFPDAIAAVAHLSYKGNEQHNPGQPLHWARGKSADEADTLMRHFLQRGTVDVDGVPHSVKVAWRALAMLQKEIEAAQAAMRENNAARERERQARQGGGTLGEILDAGISRTLDLEVKQLLEERRAAELKRPEEAPAVGRPTYRTAPTYRTTPAPENMNGAAEAMDNMNGGYR